MPQELDHVAGLGPSGEAGSAPDQLHLLQLGQVFLGLPRTNADLLGEGADSGKAHPALAGVARQSPVGQLRPSRHQTAADQSFRDENAGEEPEGIEGLADLWRTGPLAVLRLGHDLPLGAGKVAAPLGLWGSRPGQAAARGRAGISSRVTTSALAPR